MNFSPVVNVKRQASVSKSFRFFLTGFWMIFFARAIRKGECDLFPQSGKPSTLVIHNSTRALFISQNLASPVMPWAGRPPWARTSWGSFTAISDKSIWYLNTVAGHLINVFCEQRVSSQRIHNELRPEVLDILFIGSITKPLQQKLMILSKSSLGFVPCGGRSVLQASFLCLLYLPLKI